MTLSDPGRTIYLDHQATTPCAPEVIEAMLPWMGKAANPHALHAAGRAAAEAVEAAREEVASTIGADAEEIIFTSGATEANNLAIVGTAWGAPSGGIVTTSIEHRAVLDVVAALASSGPFKATYLGVTKDGLVEADALAAALTDRTVLASVGLVNNEIGAIQRLAGLSEQCQETGTLLHSDAAQALGRVEIDVHEAGVDLMSLSSHKVYGPAGVGALFAARHSTRMLQPILRGGGQERGLRPGTVPVALAVGFGRACRLANERMEIDRKHTTALRDGFLAALSARGVRFKVNGGLTERITANLNIKFDDCDAETLMVICPDILCSAGSACSSGSLAPSHVLLALGLSDAEAESSLRFGFGRGTTLPDVAYAADRLAEAVGMQRACSADGEWSGSR